MSSQTARKVVFKDKSTNIAKMTKKGSLSVKTEASRDKENLVEQGHLLEPLKAKPLTDSTDTMKEKLQKVTEMLDIKKKSTEAGMTEEKSQVNTNRSSTKERNRKITEITFDEKKKATEDVSLENNKITVGDLTSAEPSEYYWKLVAEKRQEALRETLDDNVVLRQKIELLEQKVEMLEKALSESTDVIDWLNEIVAEKESLEELSVAGSSCQKNNHDVADSSSQKDDDDDDATSSEINVAKNKPVIDNPFEDDTYYESDDSEDN